MAESRNLGEDLVIEILVKLPVKSLIRFRCVRKSWFDLIINPYFIQSHLNYHKTNNQSVLVLNNSKDSPRTVISYHSYESPYVILPDLEIYHFHNSFIRVSESCNGLICVSNHKNMVLCNPSLREFKVLPPFPFSNEYVFFGFGLGFDSITNDHKVVNLGFHNSYGKGVYKVAVYNLSTDSWREMDYDRSTGLFMCYPHWGTPLKGALHWIHSVIDKILSFDINSEVFQHIDLPRDDRVLDRRLLMVLNECLALFTFDHKGINPSQMVQIWRMHEYGVAESWRKEYSIGPLTGLNRPILLWKNEGVILELHERGLILCDLDTHEMNDLNIRGIPYVFRAMIYQESLISIK